MNMAEFTEGNHFTQEKIVGNPLADMKAPERQLSLQEKTVLWANQIFEDYSRLPQQTGPERKKAKNLIHEAARQLLQNPEKIDTAVGIWRSHEEALSNQSSEPDEKKGSFYEAVKQESVKFVKDKWEEITPNQLSQFVKSYANNILAHDFAQDLLTNYFRGPSSRNQRVDAYYNFVWV